MGNHFSLLSLNIKNHTYLIRYLHTKIVESGRLAYKKNRSKNQDFFGNKRMQVGQSVWQNWSGS